MASVLDLVKHYQHAIEKYPNDEHKILKCIDKLFNLKVTVQHLQETGVGRTVNALRKEPGEVGQASRALVNKWKLMVAAEESDEEADHNDTANHNGYGNGKDSDENSKRLIQAKQERNDTRTTSSKHEDRNRYMQANGKHSGSKRRHHSSEEEPDVKKYKSSSDRNNYDNYKRSNIKVKTEPKTESESDDESEQSHSDSSESEMSDSTVEEVKVIRKEIKTEPDHNKSSKQSSTRNEDHKKESNSKHSHESKTSKSSKHASSGSKERHSSEKSSTKENSYDSQKNSKEKESSSDKKHKTDQKEKDKRHKDESKSSKHSSSDKHKSSSQTEKHKSSLQTESSSDKHKNHGEKHSSKSEKHRSSSQSHKSDKDKHKNSSEKEVSTDKHKSKDHSSSSSSKEKHSSSSKEKSKDRSSTSKEKSDSHKSEKKHSSSSEKLKTSDKTKDKVVDKSEKSKHKSSSSSQKSSKSTTNTSSDDIPKKTKQVSHSEDSDDGIDCGSGASFAEALGMISPAKPKKKLAPLKDSCSPSNADLSPAALLAPSAKLAPLPALEISALPEISPNYKPRPPPKLMPHFTDEEAMSSIISSKNQRTKVYSGNKVFGKIPSLYEMCVHILQEHIDALEYTGGVPYEILKPVIDKATPQQLFLLEHYNPYLMEDTDHLWQKFCERHFRKQQRQEMETWREMYMRCQEEQEHKLKSLTENIKIAQEAKKAPIKQTKMAYVDTVVKPPRNIARKQKRHQRKKKKQTYFSPKETNNVFEKKLHLKEVIFL
ncbi:transcription elongation factor B polypeptide 3 isoform X2 [Plodia interpunctella]|uniref:transcription elongation factor B polypeptide 3 isoform X2 n=1 Tax=Plodia interpunctella TaxID=58824 RepID=UPI002367CDD8|nr:transcription elongation factor B polypeptide 3 isoform X2 [Plodia interpunctella]